MVTQQLLDYIKQQTLLGKSNEDIVSTLRAAGWQEQDINRAFANTTSGVPLPVSAEFPNSRQILKESWAIYKNRYKTLIGINLIPALSVIVLGLIFGIFAVVGKISTTHLSGFKEAALILLGLIALLVIIYICVWATVAQLYAIKDQTERIGWQEAFKRSKGKIWVFFGTGLLSGLAILGGFILFIIPGIIFGLWFSQSPYIVIEEGLAGSAALKRSKFYVKGRIGQIFGKLFYIGFVTVALYVALGIVLAIFGSLAGIKYDNLSWISNIFSIIWTPVVTVYGYLIYKYAKQTRP
jgi:hypothetical protein